MTLVDIVSREGLKIRQPAPARIRASKHEKAKIRKYHPECKNENMAFVPFVITTDGALAPKAKSLLNRLTQTLATKWEVSEGVIRGWIKARITMAIARASSACIRIENLL